MTTIGSGRVRKKMPERAQRPPISFPMNDAGDSSPYLIMRVFHMIICTLKDPPNREDVMMNTDQ